MSQDDCLSWMASSYVHYQEKQNSSLADYQKILKRVACSSRQINRRYFFLSDFESSLDGFKANPIVFRRREIAGTSVRQKFFQDVSNEVFEKLYEMATPPAYLIHVSCTGYGSPSAAQILAARKSPDTVVTHSYHMGCYGAFPALRMAMGFLSTSQLYNAIDSKADIVHTELCTLHMCPKDPSVEQMVIHSLFADGVAAYTVGTQIPEKPYLQILAYREFLLPQTASAMEWSIGDQGMTMTLSKDVPSFIGAVLEQAFQKWEKETGIKILENISKAIFAVHPGGPKVIDSVKARLRLSEDQVRFSRDVLRSRGNMSSATVPHIWKSILDSGSVSDGTLLISMAFGPGLTLCLSLMRVHR